MKLYAHLLLAALALTARAASIPEKVLPEELKLDASEVPKGPIEIISTEQELLEQTDTVKDVDNNLRVRPVEDIPVKVVVEEVPVLKIAEEGYEVPQDQLKKIREEIKNPGTPQRQEHETQNPEHHVDAITLKQTLQDTQSLLRQGFQGVSEGISNFVDNNEHISALQNSIQSLQKGFTERIHQLNATITNLINSGSVEVQDNVSEGQVKVDLQSVENRLNSLENSFNEGIKNLARGVEALTATKADGENAESSSTTVPASNPLQIVSQIMTNLQNTVSENFGNLTQNIQNAFQQSTPAGAQSDEGTTTSRPFGGWPNFSFFNPMQQNDENQNQKPPGSMFQLLGNFPIFGNIINRPGAQSPGNPTEASQESSAPTKPSENKEPEKKPEPESEKPEKQPEPKPEEQPQKNTGPIRQILENNPFIKGISGVVQRLQHNINNPEKPRETVNKGVKKEEPVKVEPTKAEPEKAEPEKAEPEKAEPAKDELAQVDSEKIEPVKVEAEKTPEKTEQEKGLFLFPVRGGHGGYGGGSGDNSDSRSGLKEEVATKSSPEIVKEQTVPAQEKTE